MKTIIHLDGRPIYKSNRISRKKLQETVEILEQKFGVQTMREKVRRGFNVYTF